MKCVLCGKDTEVDQNGECLECHYGLTPLCEQPLRAAGVLGKINSAYQILADATDLIGGDKYETHRYIEIALTAISMAEESVKEALEKKNKEQKEKTSSKKNEV